MGEQISKLKQRQDELQVEMNLKLSQKTDE